MYIVYVGNYGSRDGWVAAAVGKWKEGRIKNVCSNN